MAATHKLILTGILFDPDNQPIDNGKIHLYNDQDKFLSVFETDSRGNFRTELTLPSTDNLIFRQCRETQLFENKFLFKERTEIAEAKYMMVGQINNDVMNIGMMTLSTPYPKERVPLSYWFNLGKTVISSVLTKKFDDLKHKFSGSSSYTSADVQDAYGFGSVPLTGENTFKMLTNGICPIYFKRSEDGLLLAEVNWNRYNFDKLASLPNVKVFFDDSLSQSSPDLIRIELQYRRTLYASDDNEPVRIYLPNQDDFLIGLRAANSAFVVYGQTVFHLGLGHVYGAKYAQDVHDYLQGTVLGDLLMPHCQFIRKITFDLGDIIVTGEQGVINVSALNANGISQILLDTIAAINPFTYQPRTPMSDEHYFAKIQNLSYNIIREAVHEYISKNRKRIIKDWKSIHRFYLERYQSSPLFRSWNGENINNYIDTNEIGGYPRENVPARTKYHDTDIEVKAMPWIARNPAGPEEFDLYWIELDISHYIHLVSDYHSFVHRSQHYSEAGSPPITDLNFSPITINNYGEGLNGGITIDEANRQQAVLKTLTEFPAHKYALVKADSVYPGLTQRFKDATSEFISYKIDPNREIQVSSVI
jgi:hypothetical protein